MNNKQKQHKLGLLKKAQGLLNDAMELIEEATQDTHAEIYANRYTVPTLATLIDEESDYLGFNSGNVQALIKLVEEVEEVEEADDNQSSGEQEEKTTVLKLFDIDELALYDAVKNGQFVEGVMEYRKAKNCGMFEAVITARAFQAKIDGI